MNGNWLALVGMPQDFANSISVIKLLSYSSWHTLSSRISEDSVLLVVSLRSK